MNESLTIDQLLDSLGFIPFDVIAYQFGVTILGVIGIIFCTINALIFFKKAFKAPVDDYLKVINLMNLSVSIMCVPYGFCFSPKYFLAMDSYKCAIVQSVYIPMSTLIFHCTGVLDIAILLERMKIFSTVVKKYFTLAPKKVCLLILALCLIIDSFYAFVFVPASGGDYVYLSSKDGTLKQNTFYYVGTSDFANSNVGKNLLITVYVVRDFFTMIPSVILNVVSLVQMRTYFKNKAIQLQLKRSELNTKEAKKEQKSRQTEKNHLLMVITLCCIAIVSRAVLIMNSVYYLFSTDYIATLSGALVDLAIAFGPAVSFFVFHRFNRRFKKEFLIMIGILKRKRINSNNVACKSITISHVHKYM